MNNLWNTKNDWLAWYEIHDLPVINNYSLNDDCSKSLSDALTTQARIIYEDFNIFAKSLTKFQKLNATFYSKVQKSIYLSNDITRL